MSVGRTARRGFTLLETLYCIALWAMLILVMAQVEVALRKTGAQYRRPSLPRAVTDVRTWLLADIHRATAAEVPEDTRLLLTCGGKEVRWDTRGGRIVRTAGKHRMTWKVGNPLKFSTGGPPEGCVVMTFQKPEWVFVGCRP